MNNPIEQIKTNLKKVWREFLLRLNPYPEFGVGILGASATLTTIGFAFYYLSMHNLPLCVILGFVASIIGLGTNWLVEQAKKAASKTDPSP